MINMTIHSGIWLICLIWQCNVQNLEISVKCEWTGEIGWQNRRSRNLITVGWQKKNTKYIIIWLRTYTITKTNNDTDAKFLELCQTPISTLSKYALSNLQS